jgi:hypothetical protein
MPVSAMLDVSGVVAKLVNAAVCKTAMRRFDPGLRLKDWCTARACFTPTVLWIEGEYHENVRATPRTRTEVL